MNRTIKDTLVISFAPACATDACKEPAVEDFSVAAEEFNPDTLAFDVSLRENIRTLTEQLNAFKMPAHVTEAQRASMDTTQALIRSTLALTEAVTVLKQQSRSQAQRMALTLRAVTPTAPANAQAAARAAQDNNTRMILQNLLGSP